LKEGEKLYLAEFDVKRDEFNEIVEYELMKYHIFGQSIMNEGEGQLTAIHCIEKGTPIKIRMAGPFFNEQILNAGASSNVFNDEDAKNGMEGWKLEHLSLDSSRFGKN